ncbi:MAG: nucleotide pyrophosphohydrolase [Promethearchaeota archaeon]
MANIKQLQQDVDKFIQEFGGYWSPLSMLASIMEELGEISREINALEKFKPRKDLNTNPRDKLQDEIGDCLFSLICLANSYEIDLDSALKSVIDKYRKRDSGRF